MTYLITFVCYGCHLHGCESGSVDDEHNMPGTPTLEPDSARLGADRERMDQAPYHLDQIRRDTVLEAIQEVCASRGWSLLAAHVRSNHVHTVVEAEAPPERVMHDFKSYASRRLNRMRMEAPNRKRWARHGSTGGSGNHSTFRRPWHMSFRSRERPCPCSSPTKSSR